MCTISPRESFFRRAPVRVYRFLLKTAEKSKTLWQENGNNLTVSSVNIENKKYPIFAIDLNYGKV